MRAQKKGQTPRDRMQAEPAKLLSFCYYCTHRLVRKNSSQNVAICFTSRGESRRHTRESLFLHVGKPHATRGISPPSAKNWRRATQKSVQKAMEWAVFAI